MDDFRQVGINALKTILEKEQNIAIIEKNVYNIDNENYISNLYQSICDIKNQTKLNPLVESIKKGKVNWNHPHLQDLINEEEEQNSFIIQPFEVCEGALTCSCSSKRVYSYQKQTRGADEPMTTFAQCMECNKKWIYNG